MSAVHARVIVLLDDVEQMTAIGADLLHRRLDNVRVVPFNRPREALAWMAQAPQVDLVLTDFHMPEMDGLAFLAEARALHPDATRVVITAYLDLPTTTAPELGARGVHALIRKPWEWSDFTRAVFELLALTPAERAAIERVGPMAYPEGAFAELAASRAARAAAVASASPSPSPPSAPSPSPSPSPAPSPPPAPSSVCACGREPQTALSPIPSPNDDEEARRVLAYLQTRPGVAARIRAAVEQAQAQAQAHAHAQTQAPRRAPSPARRGG